MVQLSSSKGPPWDAKLAAMGPNRLASLFRPCFTEASPTVEKAVSCYKANQLVALLLSFRTFSHRLQYANFVLQGRNAVNQATDRCVQTWCHGTQSTSELCELSGPTFGFTTQEFSMVGGYPENPEKKHKTVKSGDGRFLGYRRLLGTGFLQSKNFHWIMISCIVENFCMLNFHF